MASNVQLKAELQANNKYSLEMIMGDHVVSKTNPIFETIENAHEFGVAAMKKVWPDIKLEIISVEPSPM
ncbi:hypothetical protein J7384_08705 [Endozoicomonas sp. G2_1]|uniref:hypothetical protein n=1 Tax=Endozoicomonas sp. G2_1 TaxID=2821091 RepID=UPI001ADBE09B|nr:hypothetical protein [Endozoicomonas sp. G2_1]MBO9490440.1 hypothetical protein [Endozoicomonas sp. G2_1]